MSLEHGSTDFTILELSTKYIISNDTSKFENLFNFDV